MRRFLLFVAMLAALCAAGGWWISRPVTPSPERLSGLSGDPANGETVFWAGGCAACHAADDAEGDERLILTGGHRLVSSFGTFVAPNISTDPTHGIGGWSVADFANAMQAGVSPEGRHYYPAFPYGTYAHVTDQDVVDLKSYMDTLPASDRANQPHELGLPFTIRRGIGLWKQMYIKQSWVAAAPSETLERGRYLVEALGHCAECHTPRDQFGGLDRARWMGGAPNPSGRGRIPNITPASLDWSAEDIAYYLESGFTPDYDSAGGSMASVVKNLSHLSPDDRAAIAAYVKGLAPVASTE